MSGGGVVRRVSAEDRHTLGAHREECHRVEGRCVSWSPGGQDKRSRCKHGHDPKDTMPAGVAAVGIAAGDLAVKVLPRSWAGMFGLGWCGDS
jgi:hypothetical protein